MLETNCIRFLHVGQIYAAILGPLFAKRRTAGALNEEQILCTKRCREIFQNSNDPFIGETAFDRNLTLRLEDLPTPNLGHVRAADQIRHRTMLPRMPRRFIVVF